MVVACNIHCAYADTVNEFAQAQCLEKLNIFKIDVFNANGTIPLENALKKQQSLWNEDGISFAKTLIENEPGSASYGAQPLQKQCALYGKNGTKKQTYYINLKPYIFSDNSNSQCGLSRTFEITLTTRNQVLLDKFRFQENCSFTQSVYNFTFIPHEGYMLFNGTYPDPDGGRFSRSFYKIFYLEDKLPVTNKMVYTIADK